MHKSSPLLNAVESLMYAMVCIRPDLVHAVSVVSRFMSNPEKTHWEVVKWIMRDLRGMSNLCLVYRSSGFASDIVGYTYSNYGGDLLRRRSLKCYAFTLFGYAISWKATL